MSLAKLLAAWRKTHDEALEPLIEAHTGPMIVAKTRAATEVAWLALVEDRDPDVVGRLVATPVTTDTGLLRRLEAIEKRAPDPRITRWAASHARHYIYIQHDKLQRAIARVVVRAPTSAITDMITSLGNSAMVEHHRFAVRALRELVRTPAPAELLVVAPKPATSLDALWAQHRAQPRDLGHRHVLADALQAVGDPRGELIALQLAPRTVATDKRTAELVRAHREHWLGGLPWFKNDPPIFKHGFPWKVIVADEHEIAPTLDLPEWATVEHLAVRRPDEPSALGAILKRLPWVAGLEWKEQFEAFEEQGPWPQIRVLDFDQRARWPTCYPNLEVRGGPFKGDPRAIAKQAAKKGVRVLAHTFVEVDDLPAILATRDLGAPVLGITTSATCVGNELWSIRIARGASLAEVAHTGVMNPFVLAQGLKILPALAAAGITEIRLSAPKKVTSDPIVAKLAKRVAITPGAPFDLSES